MYYSQCQIDLMSLNKISHEKINPSIVYIHVEIDSYDASR